MSAKSNYAGPRGNADVTFNTAVHNWRFALMERIKLPNRGGVTDGYGIVTVRVYGADDGEPKYIVRWNIAGTFSTTIEAADSLERFYLSAGMGG